jgi:hypothetical protein
MGSKSRYLLALEWHAREIEHEKVRLAEAERSGNSELRDALLVRVNQLLKNRAKLLRKLRQQS